MTDWKRVEFAIRRAASQMPGGWSKAFRLVAEEIRDNAMQPDSFINAKLDEYRQIQKDLD
jgi:hypothetical protein